MDEVTRLGRPLELLRQLGLAEHELRSLRRQGFVAAEYRTSAGRQWGPYFKLRWRQDGRQRVRYLGADQQAADRICAALASWQQPLRLEAEVRSILKAARRELRSLKCSLSQEVTADGRQWHGYGVRRRKSLRR